MSELSMVQTAYGAQWSGPPDDAPDHFGDAGAEYRAATEAAAVFDLTQRSQIELRGKDRASFLHNFCTQEIKRLPAGQGVEAFLTSIKGRILGHVLVFAGEEALWLDSSPGTAAALVTHLDRYVITEDVQIADRSDVWGELAVVGPQAAHCADQFLPGSGAFGPGQHGGAEGVTVRRFDFTRQPGWLIGAERDRLPEIWKRLRDAGASPGGRQAWEALRIEAGFPVYGVDLIDDHLAQEAGRTRRAISFTKGCYLGQEPIARLDALGHANRELRGLRIAAGLAAAGGKVLSPDGASQIGTVSSVAKIPGTDGSVALATLRREWLAPGASVKAETAESGQAEAVVFWNE